MSLKGKKTKSFIFLVYCLSIIALSAWISSRIFATTRTSSNIVRVIHIPYQPLKLVNVKINGQHIYPNKEFTQEGEWIKGLAVTFKNVSGKPITYAELKVDFPETKTSGPIMSFTIRYGEFPLGKPFGEPITLMPNEEITFSFDEQRYPKLKDFLASRNHSPDLHEINMQLGLIRFVDDTFWDGEPMKRDPNDPMRHLIPIKQ